MTRRAATIQGLLALAGLCAAYLTWQREPSPEEGHVVVLDITRRELQKVRYQDGDEWVELTSGKDENGELVWVRLSGKKGSSRALPSGHPVVQTDVPERLVRGNSSADKVWSLFTPLVAARALGVLDNAVAEELGLTKTKKKVLVTHGGITRTFSLAPPPPGGTAPYVRADDDGNVYVIHRQILTDFEAAKTNMVERRLHAFAMTEVDKLVVTVGDKVKEFAYKREDGGTSGDLIPAETPGTPDKTISNWHQRVFALFPADVLGKDEALPAGPPQVLFRIDYLYRGKRIGWMEIARGGEDSAGSPPTDPNAPPRSTALTRTEFSAGWMRLALEAQTLVSEGETMFGAAPAAGEARPGAAKEVPLFKDTSHPPL